MVNLARSIIDKRPSAIIVDGKALNNGLEFQENWKSYIVTDDEEQAKKLYNEENCEVVVGNSKQIVASENWAKAAICMPKDIHELRFYVRSITELQGLIIFTYDNLFSLSDEKRMKEFFVICEEVLSIQIHAHVQENGVKYLVGYKVPELLLFRQSFDVIRKLFVEPIMDTSIADVKMKGLTTRWKHPEVFREKTIPEWKTDALFSQETTSESFFSEGIKPRFMGGTIELPNHEQLAILLASGSIDREVELADGRLVVLKGTEIISHKERIKTDLDGKPTMQVKQQVRNTVLYELDLTNCEFAMLTSEEVA